METHAQLAPAAERDAVAASSNALLAPLPVTRARLAKPKRPLSAFNLFYRYKRNKVLKAISQGRSEKEDITRIVGTAPGLEDSPDESTQGMSLQAIQELRRNNIRGDLENDLLPRNTRDRTHRTNQGAMNGAMSFLELGKLMNGSWKKCDDFAKSIFNSLSEEGREQYRKRLKEYNDTSEGLLVKVAKTKASPSAGQGGDSDKKRSSDVAAPEARDNGSYDGSAATETAEARTGHPRQQHVYHDDNILASANHAAAPSNLANFLASRDASNTRLAPRTVSNDGGAPREIETSRGDAETNDSLMMRVRELEGQLAAERLRARVRELEGLLGRQRTVEDQLRAQLDALSACHGRVPHGFAGGMMAPDHRPEGLWSLANAGAIHASGYAPKRDADVARMAAAARYQQQYEQHRHRASSVPPLPPLSLPPVAHAMPHQYRYPPAPESEHHIDDNSRRQAEHASEEDAPNKKQRCS